MVSNNKPSECADDDRGVCVSHWNSPCPLLSLPFFPYVCPDFFSQLGDVFATSAIDNADFTSEMSLVLSYGPNVPEEIRSKLVSVFQELRCLNLEGILSYPYSTRELVNVVRHINTFPKEPIGQVLKNILDFDSYDSHILQTLLEGTYRKKSTKRESQSTRFKYMTSHICYMSMYLTFLTPPPLSLSPSSFSSFQQARYSDTRLVSRTSFEIEW